MTNEELDAIEARANAATAAPWGFDGHSLYNTEARALQRAIWDAKPGDPLDTVEEPEPLVFSAPGWWPNGEADRAFIANARQDVPALVAEVRRLRAELEEVRGQAAEAEHAAWVAGQMAEG